MSFTIKFNSSNRKRYMVKISDRYHVPFFDGMIVLFGILDLDLWKTEHLQVGIQGGKLKNTLLVLAIRKSGMNNEWTPNEIIMIAKNIYKIYTAGVLNKDKYIISEISKKDQELFSVLGVDLLRN